MAKYTDDDIRKASKITCKMAGEYLGISSMAVSIGTVSYTHLDVYKRQVCYTLCRRCRENAVAAGEGKGI